MVHHRAYVLVTVLISGKNVPALHTHTFNSPFSGTTRVNWYQKGKTNLDFTEARDSEWQWPYAGLHLAPDRQPHQHPDTQFFYRPDALPAAKPTVSEH